MNRVCVLTGAAGTLGTAFCAAFAADYDIVGVWHAREPACLLEGEAILDPLNLDDRRNPTRPTVFGVRADLTNPQDLERIVELTLARFGGVDLLVNAAVHSRWGALLETDAIVREAEAQFDVNAVAPLRLSTLFARRFWRDQPGRNRQRHRNIVNLSSAAGRIAFPGRGQSVYAASKAALDMLTRHMASEFAAFDVRVNALSPDAFPGRVSIEAVLAAIVDIDGGSATGTIIPLDGRDAPAGR